MLDVLIATGSPAPTPPSLLRPFTSAQHQWTGWDGSTWDLNDTERGVFLTDAGVRGLKNPRAERWVSESPTTHGSRRRGGRFKEREVHWNIAVFGDSSEEWISLEAAWWKTLDVDMAGMWTVTLPGRAPRSLMCRFVDDGDHTYDVDPVGEGWAVYGINLVAEDPFWRSSPVVRSWTSVEGVPFLDPDGSPPLHISPSATLSSAEVTNPGDLEAWPLWRATARPGGSGVTSVQVGVSGQLVSFGQPLLAGQTLEIQTDPTDQRAFLDGEEVTHLLSTFDFAPIPAGESVPLQLAMTGDGEVTASFYPRYLRAW